MNKNYSYDDMEKLSHKIQKIKKKKNLEEIRDIIIENNPNLKITENSYGIYLCFNELSFETFVKLEKYTKKYFDNENQTKSVSNYNYPTSSQNNDNQNNDSILYEQNSRLKFSNKEKTLIKKRLYDKALKINSEINNYEQTVLSDKILEDTKEKPQINNITNIFLKKNQKS